jgi:TM2 domain-containing membrane protein YozV
MNTIKTTHGVPALISFFIPGLGQLIKGQFLKAFIIWAIGGTLSFLLGWTIVVPFLIWAWNVYDAYNSPA